MADGFHQSIRVLLAWFILGPFLIFLLPEVWRLQAVDWYVPCINIVLARGFFQKQNPLVAARKWSIWICLPIGTVCFVISLLGAPIAHRMGWLDFSYGAIMPSPDMLKAIFLQKVPITIVVTWLGYEWAVRRALWRSLHEHLGLWPTLGVTSLVGFHLQWPRLMLANGAGEFMYSSAAVAELFMVEFLCGVLVALSGRLAPSILFHSMALITDRFLLGDVLNAYMPLTNYISSSSRFYLTKVFVLALSVFILAAGLYFVPKLGRQKSTT